MCYHHLKKKKKEPCGTLNGWRFSISAPGARSLLVSVHVYNAFSFSFMVSLLLLSISVWQHVILSHVSLGTHPRDSLVADEDFNNPNKQALNGCTVMDRLSCAA